MIKFNPFRSILVLAILLAAFNLSLALIAIFGPYVEGKFFPVTINIMTTVVAETPDYIDVAVTGNKVRNCELRDIRVLVDDDNNPATPPVKGSIRIINDGAKDASSIRALGSQHLGIWRIRPNGHSGIIDGSFRCHGLWQTQVRLGTWTAPHDQIHAPIGFTTGIN